MNHPLFRRLPLFAALSWLMLTVGCPPAMATVSAKETAAAAPSVAPASPAPQPAAAEPEAEPAEENPNETILQYLDQVITWHRAILATEASPANPRGVLIRDALKQNATKVLRLAFDFARSRATTLETEEVEKAASAETAEEKDAAPQVQKTLEDVNRHIAGLEAELGALQRRLNTAPGRQRAALAARRDALNGEMKLVKAQQELLQTVVGFQTGTDEGGLLGQIDELARTVPELQAKSAKAAAASSEPKAATEQAEGADNDGILGLTSQMFALSRKGTELDELTEQTRALREVTDGLMLSLREEFRVIIARGNQIARESATADAERRNAQQRELGTLLARFQQLSAAATPLAEQMVALDGGRRNLKEWHHSLDREFNRYARTLIFRLGVLIIAIIVPLVIAEFARRATTRYVRDTRRRRQLRTVRRVIVTGVILLVVILNLVSEFGSLATFAGFLTAGLAVALQNVILSVVAFFFYFGRFGIRAGSRVTIGGVTGEVVEIGLVRLYLMELAGSGNQLHATGRLAAFPNSVLFQPSAFFRQLSGSGYLWRELKLTFAADTDYALAKERLSATVETVYAKYREAMERQQAAIEHTTHIKTQVPRPDMQFRLSNTGLIFSLHYPVEAAHASDIDYRFARQLLEAVEKEPKLTLLSSDLPKGD